MTLSKVFKDCHYIEHVATLIMSDSNFERVWCEECENPCSSDDDVRNEVYIVRTYDGIPVDTTLCAKCFNKLGIENKKTRHEYDAYDWMDEHYPED